MYLENNLASKIQQSQHYTSEWDVGGAVPYNLMIYVLQSGVVLPMTTLFFYAFLSSTYSTKESLYDSLVLCIIDFVMLL